MSDAVIQSMANQNIEGFSGATHPSTVSYAIFCDILNKSNAYDSNKKVQYQDMTRPLTDYYIATSHNTYLVGDQLQSHSSSQRYADDLVKGCRCVEIDIWDGGEKDDFQPVVTHGHTLTSKITFQEVIEICAQYCFTASPYPVILSFENHCSLGQQEIMVNILQKEFGSAILLPGEMISEQRLPSPEKLKYRVIIKGKRQQSLKKQLSRDGSIEYVLDGLTGDENSDSDSDVDDKSESSKGSSRRFNVGDSKPERGSSHIHPRLEAITFLKAYNMRHLNPSNFRRLQPDVILSCGENRFLQMTSDPHNLKQFKILCQTNLM